MSHRVDSLEEEGSTTNDMGLNSNGSASQEVLHCSTNEEKKEENSTPSPQHSSKLGELISCEDTGKERGFKTPTSPDRKIPVLLECPPAPKKPKSKKRMRPPMILLDVSREIEAMFPWAAAEGRRNPINGNIKRVKVEDNAITG